LGHRTLVARATKRIVLFGFHEFRDKPTYSTPDDHLDRVNPPAPRNSEDSFDVSLLSFAMV
jgi:hypothetical protein